jgi:hypothetical protein
MWALDNRTSYAAERNWIRDSEGAHRWVVAVKATFDVAVNGALKLADEQTPPTLAPEYFGEAGRSSLKWDSDLLAVKPGTDVLLHGDAHAPRGRPVPRVEVRLRVGDIDKVLSVYGERRYTKAATGGGVTTAAPFESRPIRYGEAFGGADLADADPKKHRHDSRNPIGKGFAIDRRRLEGQPAHCIEYPGADAAKVGPAGFGPIDSFWSPRLERAGTYDAEWEASRKPLLPKDYDERFAHCAPSEQQLATPLRGGEMVELTNLTPEGLLRFELPRIHLAFTTHIRGRRVEHRAHLATVLLLPEERRLALVWQTALPVTQKDSDYVDSTTIQEKDFLD